MKKKKVSHMKTSDAKVSLQFRGRQIELTIVLTPEMERILTNRLLSPKRQGKRATR